LSALLRRQQPGIFERTRQSLLRRCRLSIEAGGRTFEHMLEICTKYNFFQNTSVVLLDFKPQPDPLALQGRISDITVP
jgi:hypothetical protein